MVQAHGTSYSKRTYSTAKRDSSDYLFYTQTASREGSTHSAFAFVMAS